MRAGESPSGGESVGPRNGRGEGQGDGLRGAWNHTANLKLGDGDSTKRDESD